MCGAPDARQVHPDNSRPSCTLRGARERACSAKRCGRARTIPGTAEPRVARCASYQPSLTTVANKGGHASQLNVQGLACCLTTQEIGNGKHCPSARSLRCTHACANINENSAIRDAKLFRIRVGRWSLHAKLPGCVSAVMCILAAQPLSQVSNVPAAAQITRSSCRTPESGSSPCPVPPLSSSLRCVP